jgi:hypothetical protein
MQIGFPQNYNLPALIQFLSCAQNFNLPPRLLGVNNFEPGSANFVGVDDVSANEEVEPKGRRSL